MALSPIVSFHCYASRPSREFALTRRQENHSVSFFFFFFLHTQIIESLSTNTRRQTAPVRSPRGCESLTFMGSRMLCSETDQPAFFSIVLQNVPFRRFENQSKKCQGNDYLQVWLFLWHFFSATLKLVKAMSIFLRDSWWNDFFF